MFAAADLQSHLRGRRHQHSLDLAAAAERSVYVRGFPPKEVEESALWEVFEKFGAIKQICFGGPQHNKVSPKSSCTVIMNYNRFCLLVCLQKLYAIVEFVQNESALNALRYPETLYLYGRKLVVKPREWKAPKKGQRKVEENVAVQEANPPGTSPIPKSIGGFRLQQETIAELQEAQSVSELVLTILTMLSVVSLPCSWCSN